MNETEKLVILGRMSAMLAHEIRNPLAGISAVTQVLEGKIDEKDPRKRYVSLIMKEVERVNKIVHDLLDYTRDSRPYFVSHEVSSLVDNALTAHAEELEARKIQVDRVYASGALMIQADQEKLERVFGNIIDNAIEAMGDGGRLTIAVGESRGGAAVAFTDTGKGCDLDDLSEMFSPFYTTKTKGTGLGLAMSAKVIEEHSGRISAESNIEGGLTLRIFLPVHQPSNTDGNEQQRQETE